MPSAKLASQVRAVGFRLGRVIPNLFFLCLSGLFLLTASGGYIPPKQELVAEHQFDLLGWELTHVGDKWWHGLTSFFPIDFGAKPSDQVILREHINIVREIQMLNKNLEGQLANTSDSPRPAESLRVELEVLNQRLESIQPDVERILEDAITQALDQLQIPGKLAGVRWPPVDFTFTPPLGLLVTSPAERVVRLDDVLLKPNLQLRTIEDMEQMIESQLGLSSLVVPLGGVATYPAQVRLTDSLDNALSTASHEWVHQYLFFRPLGFNWNSSAEMVTINETVASILGREIGTVAFSSLADSLTSVVHTSDYKNSVLPTVLSSPERFHFQSEMEETRIRLDQLLEAGLIKESKEYLEERRAVFVINGYPIRKLNNAYFAFYGSYGDSYISGNPIVIQLMAIRDDSDGPGEFLSKVDSISGLGDLEILARTAGWIPPKD